MMKSLYIICRQRILVSLTNNTTKKAITRGLSSQQKSGGTPPPPPFYGSPRPLKRSSNNKDRLPHQKLGLAIHHAVTAFTDPTRADAVAALGEITGQLSLQRIHRTMASDPTGKIILKERPIVSKATIPYHQLMDSASSATISQVQDDTNSSSGNITFGQAYGKFLQVHGFDPDGRDQVRYIQDDTLAYIMLRYRQCHDYWHAITGLPPTVLGELGLKYLELFQTGLPIAALSSTVGSLRLNENERRVLNEVYLPWAIEQGQRTNKNNCPPCSLLNVYYEKEFDTPLFELRERLNLKPAPKV